MKAATGTISLSRSFPNHHEGHEEHEAEERWNPDFFATFVFFVVTLGKLHRTFRLAKGGSHPLKEATREQPARQTQRNPP